MKRSKWLHIVLAATTVLLLGVGLQGDSLPAMASPDPAPADAPLLLGSGGVLSIAGTSFTAVRQDIDYDYESWGGVSLASGPSGYLAMIASVELPSGATITSLTFYWEDRDASNDMALFLGRYPGDGTYDELARVGSSGSGGFGSSSLTTISHPEVNNTAYAYLLSVLWDAASGEDLVAYGAQITYSEGVATATADLTFPSEDAPPSVEYLPSSDSQATVTGGAKPSSEQVQIPEEGPVLHTGGEMVELASSSSGVGPLWGETDWQYYSVAASNFHPLYASIVHVWVAGGGRYVTSGEIPALAVPLDLPHGATIQQAKVTYYDNATQNPSFHILQINRQGDGSYVWSANPDRQSTDIAAYESPALGETVDNQNHAYFFLAALDTTAMSDLRLYEFAIGYSGGEVVYLPVILNNRETN